MKTLILAGGMGTRLAEETAIRPKPMVEIGGKPILWHLMNIYAAHGFAEFVVALGYKGEAIKEYFLNFHALNANLTVDLTTGRHTSQPGAPVPWVVHLVDTGAQTQTGGRIKRLEAWLGEDDTFFMTYGDGLGNVDLQALYAFHKRHGKLATITAVRPPARFGGLSLEGDEVVRFDEKPQTGEGWINGGFFVLDRRVLDYISGDATLWELDPLEKLARDGQLHAFRHEGFWQPMDTLREKHLLETLWESGRAPWKVWP
ncbi:glucose-1-phosphate cytidylyltransferase [Geothrix sp. 21YS21S-4]|uniref:glucose-1-phosphate cytidylyltransferase n=1 Tax=Geothrix sp. 21YS21S-4 TaxID=3068889 RepID=UPI0027B9EABC|nr:glucose-1-phosphate cytidylyltransferase [Geothrix sp. 21YS21S-4]